MIVPSAPIAAIATPTAAHGDWFELVSQMQLRGPAQQLAAQLKLIDHAGARWRLALAPNAESLNTPAARQMLETAVQGRLGADTIIEIVVRSSDAGETPAERNARARAERVAQAEQTLQADPALQSITREFGARVLPGSLRLDE